MYEYRKQIFKGNVSSVVVYCTRPIAKIMGEFYIDDILSGTPAELWEKTYSFLGITESLYKNYFRKYQKAYEIEIGETILYDVAIEPSVRCQMNK